MRHALQGRVAVQQAAAQQGEEVQRVSSAAYLKHTQQTLEPPRCVGLSKSRQLHFSLPLSISLYICI